MTFDRLVSTKTSDLEDVLRQIKGVTAATIVTGVAGDITEIHVLAGSERNPKQVVRDIESVFLTKFGITIDHKKISVVQLQSQGGSDTDDRSNLGNRSKGRLRPRIANINLLSGGRMLEAKVLLEIDGAFFEGAKSGPRTANNKLRLISQAVLLALKSFLGGSGDLVSEDVSMIWVAGHRAATASISLVTDAGEERLIGAAFVDNDEREAVVKATLAAVNRRIDILLTD